MCQTHHIDVNSYFRNLLANENILYVPTKAFFCNLLANEERLMCWGSSSTKIHKQNLTTTAAHKRFFEIKEWKSCHAFCGH